MGGQSSGVRSVRVPGIGVDSSGSVGLLSPGALPLYRCPSPRVSVPSRSCLTTPVCPKSGSPPWDLSSVTLPSRLRHVFRLLLLRPCVRLYRCRSVVSHRCRPLFPFESRFGLTADGRAEPEGHEQGPLGADERGRDLVVRPSLPRCVARLVQRG